MPTTRPCVFRDSSCDVVDRSWRETDSIQEAAQRRMQTHFDGLGLGRDALQGNIVRLPHPGADAVVDPFETCRCGQPGSLGFQGYRQSYSA